MKRKIQILLLAVAMCLLIPMTSAKADVQGAGTKANPYLVSSYDDLKTYLVKGYVKLMTDISLPENNNYYITINDENEYGIDLNGYVIDLSNNKATYFICINNSNAIFTLSDSNPTKDHGNTYTSKSGAVIKGGIICNNAGQYNIIYGTCAEINVEGGTFFNNSSMYKSSGGAQTVCITARMASTKTNISNAAFYDNTNNSYYAVLWLQGPANISNCIFDGNSAKYSSVLYVQEETKIEKCTFSNNSADKFGTIFSDNGTNSFCSFKDCQIENNYVTTADDKRDIIAGIYAGYNCKGLKFDGKNIIRNNGYMSGTELIQRNVGLYGNTGFYITLGENFSEESIIALYSAPISQDYSIKYVTDGVPFESCFTVDSDKQSLKKVDNDLYLAGPITYYTVSFNTMGHGVTPNSQQVAKGDKVIDPMIPKTDGRYKFEGWYYSESYSFMWDFNTTVTADRILYAKWSAKPVVGMPCNGESEIVIDENGVFKNPAAPTYLDYVFDGWYTLPVGGTKLDTSNYLSCTYYAHWKKSDGTAVLTMPLLLDMDPDLSQYSLGEPGAYALINVNPNNEPESVKLNVDDLAAFGITYDSTEKAFVFDNVHAEAVVSGNELSIFKFCDENTRIILKNDNVIKVIAEPGGDIISGFLSEHDISFEGDGSLEIDLTGTGAPAQNYSVAGIKSGNFTNNANITINANAVNNVCGIVTTDSEFVNNGQVTVNIDGTGYDKVSCTGASSKSIVINSGTFNVTLPGKTENEYMLVWEQDIVFGSGSGYVAELNNAVDKDGNGIGIMESATGRGSLMVSSASGSNTASLAVKKVVTVTPDADQGKIFGDDDATLTFTADDANAQITGALAREAGEDVGEYAFTLGTLQASDNYRLVLDASAPVYRIEKKQITVTPDAGQGKIFGNDDAVFAYTCDDTAAEFTGALAREAGEDAGEYAFTLGTLQASDNYLVMLDAAAPAYTISKKKATLTVKNADKMLKEADPEFTYSVTGMAGSDEITGVRIEREAGEAVGEYAISASFDTSAYPNYEVEIVNGRLQISGHDFSLQIVSPEYLCSAATCTSPATYYYACECGEHGIETFDYGDLRPHAYIYFATKIEATLENDGLATYMCAECGDKVERTVSRLYEAEPEKALVITAVMEGEINTVKMDAVVENGTAKVDDITTYMFERAFEKVVKVPQNEDGTQNGDGNTAEGSDVTTGDNSETGAASSGNKNSENPSNPDNTISLDFSDAEVKVNGVEFTKGTVEALSEFLNDDSNEAEYLSIKLPDKEIILDRKVAETIGKNMSGDSIRLVVDDTSTENLNDMQQEALAEKDVIASVDAYFVCNGKELHDFEGGEAVVSMDVALDSKTDKTHIFVYYIDDEGNFEEMVTWIEDGIIYFKTTHFSDYVIIYDENKTNATKKSVKAPYIRMSKTIGLGNKFALNVTNVSEKARVTYTSSDESVATVDDNGVITAVGKGKCTIVGVIKQKGTAYKFAIDVKVKKTNKGNRQLKEKECLTPDSVTPLLNIYKAVSTKKPFALNIKRLAEDAAVTYTSEDESIATVSEDGVITGLRKGYTGINVNIQQNGKSYQYRIYVRVSTGK